jgi:hypothetical protein
MLLSAMLANSENFLNKEMPWDDPKKEEHVVKFPSNDPIASGQTRYYNSVTGLGILASTPTATTGLDNQKAYQIAGNPTLNEYKENDNIEAKKKEINEKIKTFNPSIPSEAEKIKLLNEALTKLKKEDESQIKVLDYYNIFDGDAYRFRPRGFLYIVGRKQYFELYEEFNKSGEVSIITPFRLSDSVNSAIQTSIVQWKYFKGLKGNNPQTSYFYTSQKNNGTLATYKKCLDTAHQFSPPESEKSIETFQNVLTIFVGKDGQPLIDYFKPA